MSKSPSSPEAVSDSPSQVVEHEPSRTSQHGSPAEEPIEPASEASTSDIEEGQASESEAKDEVTHKAATEASSSGKHQASPTTHPDDGTPLLAEPASTTQDDGWDCQWDASIQAWFFHNRFTGKTQWDNPRTTADLTANVAIPNNIGSGANIAGSGPLPPLEELPAAGGYNPAIHGDYDPNAWYAQGQQDPADQATGISAADLADQAAAFGATASFNRFDGQFQADDMGPGRHSDEAKSRRQMNAFFDVDAAANSHNGRSLKAERANKKPSKAEVKAFKEKRRNRKEEKRRAWLRD